jgi:hypothetical protein
MLPSRVGARKKRAKRARDPRDPSAFEIQETRQREVPGRSGTRARVTNTTGKSREKAIVIGDEEADELADTAAQAEARRSPPKISDLLEYSSETEEDSEDSLDRDESDSDDLPDAEDYKMIDFRGKNVPLYAKDKAAEVDEVTPVRKRRRFEDYLDE